MNILVFRGYTSSQHSKQIVNINDKDITVTMVPIGKPILVRKKFNKLLSNYNLDNYDHIYLVSMSSCMTSLIDKKFLKKVCLITPFYLYTKPVCKLFKSALKDFFGCHILMALSGRMGVFDSDIRIKLAEFDKTTDNIFFEKKFSQIEIINGVDHYLGELGILDIIKKDLEQNVFTTGNLDLSVVAQPLENVE